MNDKAGAGSTPESGAIGEVAKTGRLFDRTDWLSFWLTTALILAVYLFTLCPSVELGNSGIFATGAMYGGVPHPPGYPIWSIYAWLFTVLVPCFNIAWRVSFSSAVAGALACGFIALMVSRIGAMILDGLRNFQPLDVRAQERIRIVSGCSAGMSFGLDDLFWGRAVIPDPWPLSLLLFAITMCLLLRWHCTPHRMACLYAGFFMYGLTLTNSQSFLAAAPGIEFIILSGCLALGRDLFATSALLLAAALTANHFKVLPPIFAQLTYFESVGYLHNGTMAIVAFVAVIAVFKSRRLFTTWKSVLGCGAMLCLGLFFCFYVAVASMTDPPMNWGYPRTVEGFFHLITRGQYEKVHPVDSLTGYWAEIRLYWDIVGSDYGWIYLVAAVMPFFFLYRMRAADRNRLFGFVALFICMSFFMLAAVNPSVDVASRELNRIFFASSHLILALFTGCGLVLIAATTARREGRVRENDADELD